MYKEACHQNDLKCDGHVVFKDLFEWEYNLMIKNSFLYKRVTKNLPSNPHMSYALHHQKREV